MLRASLGRHVTFSVFGSFYLILSLVVCGEQINYYPERRERA